ncbi:MAG: Lsr2 family protein [Actinomycetales bacterium]
MASKTIVELVDDTDGKKADETVTFGLDGRTFEIDLSARNAKALRELLRPYIEAGRRSGGRSRRGASPRGRSDSQAIREWARASGYDVSERGRISAEIMAAYEAAPSA